MRSTSRRWIFVATILLVPAAAEAKPAYKEQLAKHFGPLLSTKLNDCGTCHASGKPGEAVFNATLPKPHNAFGARLMAVGAELTKQGKKSDLSERLAAIAMEDADRDQVSNLRELLLGRYPGLASDHPTQAEQQQAAARLSEYWKQRKAYAWKPFEPVRKPPIPRVKSRAWVRNPVDAFIAAEHESKGLTPRPEAPKEVLLRRVYLDLIGLPPTRAELQAFLNDASPNAYEKVVDRLLASPRYGERWGRHWMDVWRYSDWDGYGQEVRNSQPHLWRWRDWIIESLNSDKSYDQMIREMLAGDEIAPEDPNVLRATGFLVRNWYRFNRNVMLDRTVEGTSKAFLGVTMNCARCHDHLYDPISQDDYFRFRAFFEPFDSRLDRVPGQPDVNRDGLARAFDKTPDAKTVLFVRGDEAQPDPSRTYAPGVPASLGGSPLRVEPVPLPLTARVPDKRDFVIRETVAAAEQAVAKAREARATAESKLPKVTQTAAGVEGAESEPQIALRVADLAVSAAEARLKALQATLHVEQLENRGQKDTDAWKVAATAATTAQREAALREAHHAVAAAQVALKQSQSAQSQAETAAQAQPNDAARKTALQKANAAVAAAQKKLNEANEALKKAEAATQQPPDTQYQKRNVTEYPAASTGRRLALAQWIAERNNPLTARVAMNHIWLRHFGSALVPSVFDFGNNGQRPSHPALLDWLAAEFMERGWSMKAMHRLLVTSSTYRMDSTYDARNHARDMNNTYLWRMNSRRMEAEIIRDSVLHVAGQLDLTMGGPELDQHQGLTSPRRSVYFRHSIEKRVEFLSTFDQANVNECYARTESVMPQQALALANSALSLAQSRLLADRLWKEVGTGPEPQATPAFIRTAFLQILNREPSPEEQVECARFLREQATRLAKPDQLSTFTSGKPSHVPPAKDPQQRARENLVHVLMNHTEFVTIR